MSYPSSAVRNRRLVLFSARLLVQCVMAWWIPQAGMDESELRCFRAPAGANSQAIARNEREPIAAVSMTRQPGSGERDGDVAYAGGGGRPVRLSPRHPAELACDYP
jgi:hypothetical protein